MKGKCTFCNKHCDLQELNGVYLCMDCYLNAKYKTGIDKYLNERYNPKIVVSQKSSQKTQSTKSSPVVNKVSENKKIFVCPRCNSGDIRKCSVIYKNGVTNYHYSSEITGSVGDIFNQQSFSGDMETTGTSMTDLARQAAPPQKPEDVTMAGGIVTISIILWIFPIVMSLYYDGIVATISGVIDILSQNPIVFIVWFLIVFVSFYLEKMHQYYKDNVYPKKYRDWCNSYICMRCGNHFVMN